MSKKLTNIDFINNAYVKHLTKYDYSKVEYKNAISKVCIICPNHGEFYQIPRNHIKGQGCPKCYGKNKTNDDFIKIAISIHGDSYNYSKTQYNSRNSLSIFICPKHGEFNQTPKNHLEGKGCPKCCGKNKTNEIVITEFKLIHNNLYDYSKINYKKANTKVRIICKKHGIFTQTPTCHLRGQGCPNCKMSKGEKAIIRTLLDKNIKFNPQHKFTDCKNKLSLPFDFYLPELNTCIEFHGIQHYKPVKHFGGYKKFIQTKNNDAIKKHYCEKNKIKLLIYNNINEINKLD